MSVIIDSQNDNFNGAPTAEASIWPTALKWGAITGVIGAVVTLVSYNLGYMDIGDDGQPPSTWIITLLSFVLYIALISIGMKSYRDTDNGGYLTFGRGVLWALGYGLALGVVTALFTLVFYNFLAPDFLTDMVDAQMSMMEEQGMSEDQIEATESIMRTTMNPWVMTLSSLLGAIVIPLLIGLGVSAVLKTPPRY